MFNNKFLILAQQNGTPVSDYENQYSFDSSFDPRASPALSRKRFGSFNNGSLEINNSFIRIETSNSNCDGISPDITPNGSMRRRRSRVMTEEDDLMEFLRSSGHERNSRERKAAYGSLGNRKQKHNFNNTFFITLKF